MNESSHKAHRGLLPLALQDAPALIETVFPAQKVSIEAQAERKAVASQTLTGLGSYWKGRKPLILVRAIVLASLLPPTGDSEKDLEILEKLMAFDDEGLARRALIQNALKPKDIAALVEIDAPWVFFNVKITKTSISADDIQSWRCPLDADEEGISLTWRRDVSEEDKLELYRKVLTTFANYEDKAGFCRRPEEADQEWLFEPVWSSVNLHYADIGINAWSHQQLIDQLGVLRYGHRPRVGDAFSGGGSIPFEAGRLGCDVFAADLNPVASMLTWSALSIAGADSKRTSDLAKVQTAIAEAVDAEIAALGIEEDEYGNRAKAYLYCLETRCPETGWMIPIAPSWVISKKRRVIARLIPDYGNKCFKIAVETGVLPRDLETAELGTIQGRDLVYELGDRIYRTPMRTIRGEYRDSDGVTKNHLRRWKKTDFKPRADDVFQERLYAIQWFSREALDAARPETFFSSVTLSDLDRENKIEKIVGENLARWQQEGLVSDMPIETGKENEGPIRTNGWTYWHHMFTPRSLLVVSLLLKQRVPHFGQLIPLIVAKFLDNNSKSCRWATSQSGGDGGAKSTFDSQALKTIFNWANRALASTPWRVTVPRCGDISTSTVVDNADARGVSTSCDLFITDPPYADAVRYHEITEFFIAWLRKNPPAPFDRWTWDSRRALAIKGWGNDFRRGMVEAYRAITDHMPGNGMQCVMFTHQDAGVWSDMVGIFWAAGLQVVAAWYVATETTSELKKGGYVQGTVILMLKKRAAGERAGFKQRILPAVRTEVQRQIDTMMHLNDEVKGKLGEPAFNDSDLQMAGYGAALKVLTSYTSIGGEDMASFALRPRRRGDVTVVDEIVQQAAEAANSLLVPEGLGAETWARLSGMQRFYLRMMDMETTGAAKLDNYQNFAKAFRVEDYARVMGNMAANRARLKHVTEFTSRDLTDSTEIGATWLGRVIIGLQQLLSEIEPQTVISQLQVEMPDFMEVRPLLIDVLVFIERNAPEPQVRGVAEVLGARLRNLRALGQ